MDTYRIPTVIAVLISAVVIASAAIITSTQHGKADAATTHAQRVESALAETQSELDTAQVELSMTSSTLSEIRTRARATADKRDKLSAQVRTCRYVVRVNDHLLRLAGYQQQATSYLLRDARRAARVSVNRARHQAVVVQRLVKLSGHRTIGALVDACAPVS